MKHKLLFPLVAVMFLAMGAFAEDEPQMAQLTFNVDDAARVALSIYGEDYADLQTGANTIEVPQWSNIEISPKEGCILKSVVDSQGNELTMSNGNVTFMVYEAVPETYTITSEKVSEVKFTIDVDNASKVSVLDKNYKALSLTSGVNEMEMSAINFPLLIGTPNYGDELYMVLLDGEAQTANYGSYAVTPQEGSVIKIMADFPDIDCSLSFTYSEGIEKFFTAVVVNGEEISDLSAPLDVKCGSSVELFYNASCWDTEESPVVVRINDNQLQGFWPGYKFVVRENTVVAVEQATAVEMVTVNLEVDQPGNVKVYRVNKYYRDLISLQKGENVVELPADYANLVITNVEADGEESKIIGVTIDGRSKSVPYYNEYEIRDLEGGEVIKVFTEGNFGQEEETSDFIVEPVPGTSLPTISSVILYLEPDFYYDDEEDLIEVNDSKGIYFTLDGERFCDADIYIDIESMMVFPAALIYLPGSYELVIEEGALSWIREENGKFIANDKVLTYAYNVEGITTDIDELPFTIDPAPGSRVASLEVTMTLKDGYYDFDVADAMAFIYRNGKEVCGVYAEISDDYDAATITPEMEITEAGEYDLVFMNYSVSCDGDDDYYYNYEPLVFHYTVDSNVAVREVEVETAAYPEGVYTLTGIKVADTADNLPAGIYIVNGKKLVIR